MPLNLIFNSFEKFNLSIKNHLKNPFNNNILKNNKIR